MFRCRTALGCSTAQIHLVWLGFGVAGAGCSLTADLDSLTAGDTAAETTVTDEQSASDAGPRTGTRSSDDSECTSCDTQAGSVSTSGLDVSPPRSSNAPNSGDETSGDASATFDTGPPLPSMGPSPDAASGSSAGSDVGSDVEGDSDDSASGVNAGQSSVTSSPPGDVTATSMVCDATGASGCASSATLIHRYSFTDIGAAIVDSVGAAHGTPIGATQGEGRMVVTEDGYGELPSVVLEGLTDLTIEVWFTSYATRGWERVFDFGETENGSGKSYLFFTSQVPSASGTMRFAVRPTGKTERVVNTANNTADNVETHIAAVFDDTNDELRVYMNGQLSGSASNDSSLSDINFVHGWLGRSMFSGDPKFEGDFNEFRIYDGALDSARIERSFEAGPDVIVP